MADQTPARAGKTNLDTAHQLVPFARRDPQPNKVSAILEVCSVNMSTSRVIGLRRNNPVVSAVDKRPTTARRIKVTYLNLDGDEQADRTLHGGIDKALYVYPCEHYQFWNVNEIPAVPGLFGENISSRGLTEADVHLGDRWEWGTSELVVTQPRTPCFKLAMHLNRPSIARLMINSSKSGWYLRVLRPGTASVSEPMRRTVHRSDLPTVADTFTWSLQPPRDARKIRRLLSTPELATQYAATLTGLADG